MFGITYNLRHTYGRAGHFYSVGTQTLNRETGTNTKSETRYYVRNLIYLPLTMVRQLTALGLGLDFTDNEVTVESRLIIVDDADLPANYRIQPNDYFVIDGRRFNIQRLTKFDAVSNLILVREVQRQALNYLMDITETASVTEALTTE